MVMNQKYSVLMSVYYKENPIYFRESIESVLNQTVRPDEFVIVCDGPLTEKLDEVIAEYSKREPNLFNIVRLSENVGLGMALNKGILECHNEIIARMDSDDISYKDRMERQLYVMENKKADIVSGTVNEFSDSIDNIISSRSLPETNEEIRKFARRRNPFNHPAIMYRKESVLKAGNYQRFDLFEDYYLWIRMLKSGSIGYNIKEPLLFMRAGEGMYMRRGGLKYASLLIKFKSYLLTSGYSNIIDFVVSTGVHIVIALLPTGLRKKFYERVLRK